jgi:hypothetical protein
MMNGEAGGGEERFGGGKCGGVEELTKASGILYRSTTLLVRGGRAFYNPSITASDAVVLLLTSPRDSTATS